MEAQPTAHPSARTLSFYHSGQLDRAEAEAVSRHLSKCGSCRSKVAGMTPGSMVQETNAVPARSESTPAVGSSLDDLAERLAQSASPPAASSLPAGLADHPDYQVLRELGRGGMGVVYLAENKLMGRKEVLKVVSSHLLNRQEVLDRFLREVRAAALLRHPNIVAAYSASRTGESIVLAMEYIDGTDLAKLVETKGPLPVTHACNFVYQTALGLQHAQERGMVHRDIKPSNLMLTREGKKPVIKILDFGLAKVSSETGVDAGLTHEGQMLGTPHYISPEQMVNAQKADIRADIYSLGCSLYCLLTGHPPFDAPSLYELLQAHHSMDAPLLNLVRPDVPAELAALVAKMMAKDPQHRFQTPIQVAQALAPFTRKADHTSTAGQTISRSLDNGPDRASTTEQSRASRPQSTAQLREAVPGSATSPAQVRLQRRNLALAGTAMLAVGLIAAWTIGRPRPVPPPPSPAPPPPPSSSPERPKSSLADAEAAIRSAKFPEAMEQIDRYLADPQAGDPERASKMRLELLAATSDMEADLIARSLSDQELKENLNQEARPMAGKVEIPGLASAYRDNMLRALKREKARREAISRDKLVQESPPAKSRSGHPRQGRPADRQVAESSLSPRDRRLRPPPRPEPVPSLSSSSRGTVPLNERPGKATIDDVLTAPQKYDRKTFVLDGLFRIGTRVDRVRDPSGQALGFSLPFARDDGRTICPGDGRIVTHGMMLLVDIGVVSHMERVFRDLRVVPSSRPVHRSIVEVRMETLREQDHTVKALVINSLEILGSCNFGRVAEGNYAQAFRVIDVTSSRATMRYGDGKEWVDRLGGEEKFVGTVRRKLKEMQRHVAANIRQAQFDKVFQKEMAVSMRMAEAQARSMQAAVERAEMSMSPGIGGFR